MAAKVREPKTTLQALFLKRVQEEMDRLRLSRKGLSERTGGPSQTTFNDIMNGSDPTLERVHEIATALDVPAWTLFRERAAGMRNTSGKVKNFPQRSMLGESQKPARRKSGDRE